MNGVENMLYMQSVNASDGTITLRVTFDVGTDRNTDQVNAQNRVPQALPEPAHRGQRSSASPTARPRARR